MKQMFSWGVFFENAERATLRLPFGPDASNGEDNMISDFNDPWMLQFAAHAPDAYEALRTSGKSVDMDMPFAFIVVNPPVGVDDDYAFTFGDVA